ncbi:hypothetical protein [Pseudoalteromonas sp.]|uniref:hypothetical protein n=1 Tax=Pseudoalteromonas sp. TaxID=53249 RepID=UPI002632268E|nr:hypothetical protein [Pseudoalteromonas sp.]MCP4585697.1 hypothetical protein [Pseudoalteromonas sp.]
MPSTIDYSRMLPLSIPAMASRRKYFPSNGSTFSRQGNRQIRIEIAHPSALLDPTHSYIELRVANTGAQTFGADLGGANVFFENIRVEQGGKLLSYTQQSNRLHSAILAPVMTNCEGSATESITEGQRAYNGVAANSILPRVVAQSGEQYGMAVHNSDAFQAAGGTVRFTMPITSGLFSQDKLIPLPLVDPNAPLTLILDLGASADVGVWNGAPGVADIQISECAYIAHMIEVGPDVVQQFKQVQADMGGQLALSGQDFEYFSQAVPAGSTGQVALACPARKRSIKSFLWCAQSNTLANTLGPLASIALLYNLSFAGSMNIESFQFQVGPILYPAGEPVKCWSATNGAGAVGHEFDRGQAAMELAKAVGTMSKTNPTGLLSNISYGCDVVGLASGELGRGGATLAPASNEKYCVCPFGISTDGFSRDVVESGIDTVTLAQDTNLLLNWAAADNSGAEDQIVHVWCLFDQHYYFNSDGSVTYSN